MANVITKTYTGISEDNFESLSIEKNTTYTLNVKSTDGAAINANNLTYTVDGDDAVVSYDEEYSISLKLSGTMEGTTEIPEGVYTFRLVHEAADDSKWVTTFKDAAGNIQTIKLQKADIAKTAADASLEQNTNIKGDFTTLSIVRIKDGVADEAFAATYKAAAAACGTDAAFNKLNNDNAKLEAHVELTLVDYAKSGVADTTMSINGTLDLDTQAVFEYTKDGDDYTGSRFNESVTGTSANETFNMGTNTDDVTFKGFFGNDEITVNKGETIDLKIQTVGGANATVTKTETAEGLLLEAENVYTLKADVLAAVSGEKTGTLEFSLVNTGTEVAPVYQWQTADGAYTLNNESATFDDDTNFYAAAGLSVNYVDADSTAKTVVLANAKVYDSNNTDKTTATIKVNLADNDAAKAQMATVFGTEYSGTVLVKGYTDVEKATDTATLNINSVAFDKTITNVESLEGVVVGSWLNEQVVSKSTDETFALGTGTADKITFNGNFGNDTVYTVNNEALTFAINKGADLTGATKSVYTYTTNGSDVLISSSVNYSAEVTVKTAVTWNGHVFAANDKITLKLVEVDGNYVWQDTLADVAADKHLTISAADYANLKTGGAADVEKTQTGGGANLVLTQASLVVSQYLNGGAASAQETGYETFVTNNTDYDTANKALLGYIGSGTITLKDYAKAVAEAPATLPSVKISDATDTDLAGLTYTVSNITADYSGSRLNETVSVKAGTTSALTVDLGNGTNSFTGADGNTTVTAGDGNDTITTGAGADVINAGKGTNTITAGKGDDTVTTVATSTNTINVNVGDGHDTLVSAGTDTIAFENNGGTYSSVLKYSREGNDIKISREGSVVATGSHIDDSIVVKDFLGAEKLANSANIKVNDLSGTETALETLIAGEAFTNDVKSGVINGSWAKDAITATGDATVTANGGIDTVTLAKDSTNTVIYNVGDAPAGEKLTLSAAEVTNLVFNAPADKADTAFAAVYSFVEDIANHKLTITRTYYERTISTDSNWAAAVAPNNVTDVIEITDYLTNGKDAVTITDSIALAGVPTGKEGYTPYLAAALEDVATIAVAAPAADFNGSFLSEVIAAPTAAVKIATGAGNDVVNSSANVETVTLGAGNKTFNYDTTAGGKDTIELTKDVDKLVIDLTNIAAGAGKTVESLQAALSFSEDLTDTSKDLVISDTTYGATHNVTVKDYFKNGAAKIYFKGSVNTAAAGAPAVYEDTLIALEDVVTAANNAAVNLVAKSATEGATFEGSLLSETVNGTALADVIATGDGDDVITAGAGDDEIFGGEGANVYHFGTNSGNDTVYMTGEAETLVFDAPVNGTPAGVTYDMTKEDTYSVTSEFSEDKKDVIITVTAKGTKAGDAVTYTDTITLKNYMDGESQGTLVSYKEWDESTKTYVDRAGDITLLVDTASLIEEKGNKVTGTDLADNLVFDDNKSRTIYGLAGDDHISVEGGKNTIYAGAGDDFITSGAGADTIDGGEGNNMLYFAEGDGKDVVVDGAGNDILNVTVADPDSVKTAVKGKDLVISYGEYGDTITLKGYMTAVMADENHSVSRLNVYNAETGLIDHWMNLTAEAAIEGLGGDTRVFTVEAADTSKAANLKGSTLSEAIYGTEGNNTIKGGGGNDVIYSAAGSNKVMTESRAVDVKKGVLVADEVKVYAGLGTDTITAGKGNDTYVFQQGMLNGTINANTVGTVTLDMSAFNAGQLDYTVVGKDLVISNTFDPYAGTAIAGRVWTTEKLVVKNYANNKLTDNIAINDGSGVMNLADYLDQIAVPEQGVILGNEDAVKAQKLTGSFLNETFLGGAGKDTISTGAGQDTVFAGAGDDKITGYIAKEGKNLNYADIDNAKTFVFDYNYDKVSDVAVGSGNDTIVNAKVADTIVFRLADNNIKDSAAELAENLTLTQKGKNLIIGYNETVNAKGKTVYADSITLNNYFGKNVESVYSFAITDTEGRKVAEFDMDDFENGVLKSSVVSAIKTAANTAQGYVDNTLIVPVASGDAAADALGNTTYNGAANIVAATTINDTKGNDIYNLNMNGVTAKTTVTDTDGIDELVVTTQGTGFALFNVKADGTAAAGATSMFVGDSANLTLNNNATLQTELTQILGGGAAQAKTIEVANQFVAGSVEDGAGAMEQVAFENFGKTARDYNVDAVKAEVASWLADNNYADTATALAADADNAATLLNLYMGGQA